MPVAKLPKKLSPGEARFLQHCKAKGLTPVQEYRFHATRRWRFDFAFPELRIAVEVEGGTWSRGKAGHTSGVGYRSNCQKYNSAVLLGWSVFRFTSDMVHSGEAINTILPLIGNAA